MTAEARTMPLPEPIISDDPSAEPGEIRLAHDRLEVVLGFGPDAAVRVARIGVPGAVAELPGDQPAVEIVTVDAGHAPAASRLAGGAVSRRLRYAGHRIERHGAAQVLVVDQVEQGGTLRAELSLTLPDGVAAVRAAVAVTVAAEADEPRQLLALAPLALAVGLGADGTYDPDDLVLAQADSDWLGEGRWRTLPLRAAGLADLRLGCHETGARGCVHRSSHGLWSTGQSLPVGILASATAGGGAWAWQVESTAGWRWEIGEHRSGPYLAASGPTDADNGWSVAVGPGASYRTPTVALAVGADLTAAAAALTDLRRAVRRPHPDATALHVVFNDYMNTLMGDPTTERLLPLIDAAAEAGAEVFCIDAGWYDDSDGWWSSVGAWQPSTTRFPGGLQEVIDHIVDRGLVPGLWLEPEVVGVESPVAETLPPEAFLTRRGQRVVEHGRYHLDLRHPAARAHLDEVVDRLVGVGVGYFKLDYNINPVAGTDRDADSPADGLAGHAAAHRDWLAAVLDRHPGLTLENCASGAMRADPQLLALMQLQSTSDQQAPLAYPPIAAAAPLGMLPETAGNWAYPQPEMSDEEISFTLCTGLLGRLYLSGHIDAMSTAQRSLVAEAVAAHKRLRTDVAAGHARWPLGLDQWDAPWVALAVDSAQTTHLTVWRRPGAARTVEVPLPEHVGHELVVTTTFPTRLAAWQYRWESASGVLRIVSEGEAPAARTLRLTRGRPVQHVGIDVSARTGAVHGGATGMLYGLVEPGVPSDALLAGARPRSIAQKPAGGLQHPGGDAVALAGSFFAAGGTDVYVYVQDALTRWPYEEIGIAAYLDVLGDAVRAVVDRPDRDRYVWVPFNEGDWIWYADWSSSGKARFLADWDAAVARVRSVDPAARIAGPNEAVYHPRRVRDFLAHAREQGTLPDVFTWHELQPSSLETYRAHLAHLRSTERELGIEPSAVCIDEYGNRRDMSVPAQVLQWVESFESTKVDADLAYWTLAGNLDDHAVGAAAPNGGWWLLHWYASLSGETVAVQVPHPDVRDSLRALAAVDEGGAVMALLGGTADDLEVDVAGLPAGQPYRVRVSTVPWSGYQGVQERPVVLSDDEARARPDGTLMVRVPGGDPTAVHRVDLVPGGAPHRVPGPWQRTVGLSDARVVDCEVVRHGDDPQHYHGTDAWSVVAMPAATSAVEVDVDVPTTGAYDLGIGYGTEARPGTLALTVDDEPWREIALAPTLDRRYTARVDVRTNLSAGRHRVRLSTSTPDGRHLSNSDVAVDHVRVRSADLGPVRYEALDAWQSEDRSTFFVVVGRTGAYRLDVALGTDPGAETTVLVDGRPLPVTGEGSHRAATVALARGAVRLDVQAPGGALDVTLAEARDEVREIAAEELELHGDAHLVPGGRPAVAGLGSDSGSGTVVGQWHDSLHLVTLEVSNAYRLSGHEYNTDAVVQWLSVGQRGRAVQVAVPHTVHDDGFDEVSVVVRLAADDGPLVVSGLADHDGPGARLAGICVREWARNAEEAGSGTMSV